MLCFAAFCECSRNNKNYRRDFQEPFPDPLSEPFLTIRTVMFFCCLGVLLCFGFTVVLSSCAKLWQQGKEEKKDIEQVYQSIIY